MFTKAWKLYCPSISKKEPSVYWDWSNGSDGVRIFEVFCADLTGHTSYIIVRITRNTEDECNAEFSGQLTDGYFEDYRGNVRGTEIAPSKVKLDLSLVAAMRQGVWARDISDIRYGISEHKYISTKCEDSAKVILTYFGKTEVREELEKARSEYDAIRVKTYGWHGEETPENKALLTEASKRYVNVLAAAWSVINMCLALEIRSGKQRRV